jgi:DNA-binding response OmpR family regulator
MQAQLVRRYLEHDGHTTLLARDGWAAVDAARRHRPDLIVLDVMMPGLDGMSVCRTLRRESSVLVLMLTARSTEADLLQGLEVGADDYMTKPYSARELTARVRTLLRRARPASEPDHVLTVGPLRVDVSRREVWLNDRAVPCTGAEFEILAALAGRPGRVFTRPELLNRTSGAERESTTRTIDVHIRNLRKKIEPRPDRPTYLLTVIGVGYKLREHRDAG